METKTIARVGAVAFVAVAFTMTALQLRDEPAPAPVDSSMTVAEPDTDPLPTMLRHCASLGEAAGQERLCLDAWAENRRRFLSVGADSRQRPSEPSRVEPTIAVTGVRAASSVEGR
jgi:conjugative transfer region protein TrbK